MAMNTQKSSLVFYGGLFGVALLLVGGAIMFGQSDKGQIDVSAAIANSNAERQAAADASGETAPVIAPPPVSTAPNGGLVGKGDTSVPPPQEEVQDAATTTETGSTEEGDVSADAAEAGATEVDAAQDAETETATETSEEEAEERAQ